MRAQAHRAALSAAVLSAVASTVAAPRAWADAIVTKDANGIIRVTPYTVSSPFQNNSWTTAQQDAFWARQTQVINAVGAAGISSNRYFENEKASYGRAMFVYLYASANNNTSSMTTARNFLVATPSDGEDGGSISGMQNTDEVDLFASFTIKWQMPKYFFFGKHTASVLGSTSGYLHHVYPSNASGYDADKVGTTYMTRMTGAFGLWTNDNWVAGNEFVGHATNASKVGQSFPDPYYRPNVYNQYIWQSGMTEDWKVSGRNSWVDIRNTDNLKSMREMGVFLAAIESGNTGNRDRYAARLQQHIVTQFRTGQSEWDSQNYFIHGVTPVLSLYDYAPEDLDGGKIKKLAKASLDFQLASAATKYFRGAHAGPSKRSNGSANIALGTDGAAGMWQYFGDAAPVTASSNWYPNLQPMLSAYRPPQAVLALATKSSGELRGVELINTKPSYANWADPGSPQELSAPRSFETLYYGQRFQAGSLVSNSSEGDVDPFAIAVNNNARGVDIFDVGSGSGGFFTKRQKDQVGQYRNMMIWLRPNGVDSISTMQIQAPSSATLEVAGGVWFFRNQDANTFLAYRPINLTYTSAASGTGVYTAETIHTATQSGSGYFGLALEIGEQGAAAGQYADYAAFKAAILASAGVDASQLASGIVQLTGADGKTLKLGYNPASDLPAVYRNTATAYSYTDPANYALFKPVTPPDASPTAPAGVFADGASVPLTATAKGYAPISLGWKQGTLRVIAGGFDFSESVDASGNTTFSEVADVTSGGVAKVEYFLNSKKVAESSAGGAWTAASGPLAAGRYHMLTRATDIVGNVGNASGAAGFDVGTVREWGVNASGNWGTGSNWIGSVAPGGAGHAAYFGDSILAPRTVTVTAPVTVTTLQFAAASPYTIGGSSPITLDRASGRVLIQSFGAASPTISAPLTLGKAADVETLSAATLTLSGLLTTNGNALHKSGPGTLAITGSLNLASNTQLNLDGGATTFALAPGNSATVGTGVQLNIAAGASATIDASQQSALGGPASRVAITNAGTLNITAGSVYAGNLDSSPGSVPAQMAGTTSVTGELTVARVRQQALTINAGGNVKVFASGTTESGSDEQASILRSLTIAHNGAPLGSRVYHGQLDLANNDLIVDYSGGPNPYADLLDMLRAGRGADGTWNGNGIISSTARTGANNLYAIGIHDNADARFSTFDGIAVTTSTILLKFTYAGDVNLSGAFDTTDLFTFLPLYDGGASSTWTWAHGDINYDGRLNTTDLFTFVPNYNPNAAHLPEPGTLGILALAATALLARRRS